MTSETTDLPADAALTASAKTLLGATAVRRSANRMLALALDGTLNDWKVDLGRLPATADFVAQVIRDRYPRLDPPLHARWRHFSFGEHDLWTQIAARHTWPSAAAKARAAFDLAITSVLLDAGAGTDWHYTDPATGLIAARSEGLALASLRWFENGGLSEYPGDALRVDAPVLLRVDAPAMNAAFQVSDANPLLGAQGRASLLNRLGAAVQARPDLFAIADAPRPGGLFDALARLASGSTLPAQAILATVLEALGPIWPNRPRLGGVSLGDCWPHPALTGNAPTDGYAALHKLSQWLTYSLIEPLQEAGITVYGLDELTGLAEYRNGGLFMDMGVLVPRDVAACSITHAVSEPFVVAWRAITVALLDRVAPLIGPRLGMANDSYLLARVLEGGTWAAGRRVARKMRGDGGPPFQISSDGTVL